MRTIMILLDSLNRHHLKIYNPGADAYTPNIDRFAADSVVFDNHFIGSAPCMPARRDIFTGRLGFLERNWGPIEPFDITLPACLRENGFYTHIITDHTHYFEIGGENYTYLFNTWDYHRGQEFDTWISRLQQPEIDKESYGKKSSQYLLNRQRFTTDAEYPSPRTFRAACEWVNENKGGDNFFLLVEAFDPHEPFDCPQEFHEIYNDHYEGKEFNWSSYAPVTEPEDAVKRLNTCYKATLSMADKWFGKFIETLKQNDMYEDTLIIFTTDHGHMLGEHNFTGKNFMHAYNEMAHIPLFMRLPGGACSGSRVSALTQNIDIMPTVLKYHKCEVPETVKGYSLLDVMENSAEGRDALIYGWFGRAVNIFDGKYTYFRAPKDSENKPLFNYCGIPTTIWRYYGNEYADSIEMGRFLPYTNYPVYRIPTKNNEDIYGDIKYVLENELYDIETDYSQQHPISDENLESLLCKKLISCMENAECPLEQFERLGLNQE